MNIIFSFSHYVFNPFPNKPWFLHVCKRSISKTLWEKGKLLVTSNFSFSHSVVYLFGELSAIFINFEIVVCKLFQFGTVLNFSFGKGLNAVSVPKHVRPLACVTGLVCYYIIVCFFKLLIP